MMKLIVNATPGVLSVHQHQKDYELHKHRVKIMKKFDEKGQLKPFFKAARYTGPLAMNTTVNVFGPCPHNSTYKKPEGASVVDSFR